MASKAEEIASRYLRTALSQIPAGEAIADSPEFSQALTSLEWFLPEVLGEVYREWIGMGLDGIYPHLARKIGEGEAEIFGLCCLISDQSLTPFHLQLQISATSDEIHWLELRLGEKGPRSMVRTPYPSSGSIQNRLHALRGKIGTMEWVYKVTFGQRQK